MTIEPSIYNTKQGHIYAYICKTCEYNIQKNKI